MTKMLQIFAFGFLIAASVLFSGQAHAQVKIGIVNFQSVLDESLAAVSINEQLVAQGEMIQSEIKRIESALIEKEQAALAAQVADNEEEFNRLKSDYEQTAMQAKNLMMERKQDIEQAAMNAVNELRKKVVEIATEYANENGYELILSEQSIIMSADGMDITSDIKALLDEKVKTVEVKIDE